MSSPEAAPFPALLEAEPGASEGHDPESFLRWADEASSHLDDLLLRSGAVLLRDFAIEDAATFERFVQLHGNQLLRYAGGNSPRTRVHGNVYTSTEYPASEEISLHHELSYAARWPSRLFFFCAHPPERGGETTIASGRAVTRRLADDLLTRFDSRGVRYVQHLHPGKGFGKSWQQTFETSSKEEVEALCREQDISFSWTADGALHVEQHRAGVLTHALTKERLWFNQAEQWHPSSLGPEIESILREGFGPGTLPLDATFGDGTEISAEDLQQIRESYELEAQPVAWRRRDLLILDNVLALHGRRPFQGQRQVLVAMVA